MFAEACTIAREFTKPIVISYRQSNGECNSIIGTIVVVNEDGWFVTAFHILKAIGDMTQSLNEYTRLSALRKSIEENTDIKSNEKHRLLHQNKIPPTLITNFSVWCGYDGLLVSDLAGIPAVDLGVGRIVNFDGSLISTYPLFKDPNQPMVPGRSLCKMGFPFSSVKPIFKDNPVSFQLPPGSVPLPFFPIDGIYTRATLIGLPNTPQNNHSFPLLFLETSSPGLKGQSGGPTFDVHGNIWAIQVQTVSHALGFQGNSSMTAKQKEHFEHQHFHVGLGVHSQTVVGFLTEKNITFRLSLR